MLDTLRIDLFIFIGYDCRKRKRLRSLLLLERMMMETQQPQQKNEHTLAGKRAVKGLRLIDLSKKMEEEGVPTSPSAISRIERGLSWPRLSRLTAYCALLGMTMQEMKEIHKASACK